jgi:TonB family protein
MLMGIYIEEGNYPRAESLMEETFRERSPNNEASVRSYFALAGRAVNGTRSHLQRYRDFGINVSDPTLPGEALTDLSRLRALLERMIAQAKEITSETRAYDSLALLEDVLGIRMSLAVDSEDRTKWETEYANAREVLASSETQVAALRGIPFLSPSTKPANPAVPVKENNRVGDDSGKSPASESKSAVPTAETGREKRAVSQTTGTSASSSQTEKPAESSTVSADGGNADVPRVISTGLLNARATKRVIPTYPSVAKSAGAQGVVRVYVTIDESGKVIEVSRSEGPIMLRETAEQAARAWKFAPTAVGGKA